MSINRHHLILALRWILAGVFAFAAWGKIMDPNGFVRAVANYQLLPTELVGPLALWLPWLELVAAICLACGFWAPGALLIIDGLLLLFLGALVASLVRGLDIGCGCFDLSADGRQSLIFAVWRNIGLLAVGIWLLIDAQRRSVKKGRPVSSAVF